MRKSLGIAVFIVALAGAALAHPDQAPCFVNDQPLYLMGRSQENLEVGAAPQTEEPKEEERPGYRYRPAYYYRPWGYYSGYAYSSPFFYGYYPVGFYRPVYYYRPIFYCRPVHVSTRPCVRSGFSGFRGCGRRR